MNKEKSMDTFLAANRVSVNGRDRSKILINFEQDCGRCVSSGARRVRKSQSNNQGECNHVQKGQGYILYVL